MPRIIRHNLALKILSLIGAIVIWGAVRTHTNPIVEHGRTFRVFTSAPPSGMQVLTVEPSEIYVTVRGRRLVFERSTLDYVRLVADVSETKVGSQGVPVYVQVLRGGLEVVSMERQRVQVELDTVATVKRAVQAQTRGKPADGFAAKGWQVQPNEVTVSGAASNVHRVASVVAFVDISGSSATVKRQVQAQARDENNSLVENVSIEPEKVSATIPIERVNTKTVPIRPNIVRVPAGWVLVAVHASPTTVTLGGSGAALAAIQAIDTAPVNISDQQQGTSAYSVPLQVPAGVSVIGAGSARVTVTIRRARRSGATTGPAGGATAPETSAETAGGDTTADSADADTTPTEPSHGGIQVSEDDQPDTDTETPAADSDAGDADGPAPQPADTTQPTEDSG